MQKKFPAAKGYWPFVIFLSLLLAACGGGSTSSVGGVTSPGGGGTPPVSYTASSGVAEKGPLLKGSTVTAQELDANLSPTGKQYSYQINSDLGTFSPTSSFGSQFIGLNANGYYFDEVTNAISGGTVTLNGLNDLSADTVLNVNLLTTLAYQRINNLVSKSHMTFSAAQNQAENEVLAALNINKGSSYGSFGSLNISKGRDGDKILVAVSSLFVYGNSSGALSSLIADFQSDIADNGIIDSATTKNVLVAAGKNLNPVAIAANLSQKYSSIGVSYIATDISNWIDQSGEGLSGKFKFQVPDATQSSLQTFPNYVVNQVVGASVSVTAGQLWVNGVSVTGPVTIKQGDVVAVSPPAGTFPNGVLTTYLVIGTSKFARVSFISGLRSIAVTPANPSLPKGLNQQFQATGTFSDTSTRDLTASAAWSSDKPAVATVNQTSGLANGIATGSAIITATSGSATGNTALTVTAATLQSIAVSPNPLTTGVDMARQPIATGTYSDGSTANLPSGVTWSSGDKTIATVDSNSGVARGASVGSTTISAKSGTTTGTATVSVVKDKWVAAACGFSSLSYHTATLLTKGKVLNTGGFSDRNGTSVAELYDETDNTLSPAASMATRRYLHTATLLPNGRILTAGGRESILDAMPPVSSAELYDPTTNTWSPAASMAGGRSQHTATLLTNGKVLVVGGDGGYNKQFNPLSAELYDPATNTWSPAASTAKAHGTATLLTNGKVLATGGGSAELYDPATNTWSPAGSMATSRYGHTATLLPNGKVLAVGGLDNVNASLSSAELYDPTTNTWSPAASMAGGRSNHTATLLTNGKVLVAAGFSVSNNASTLLLSAELYDPTTNTWSPAASVANNKGYAHTATLLTYGAVLLGGGNNSPTCELYFR
jgi:uncharacterized protein YjdB